jgi:hypothetical protein
MLTYADVYWRMLTYAGALCSDGINGNLHIELHRRGKNSGGCAYSAPLNMHTEAAQVLTHADAC